MIEKHNLIKGKHYTGTCRNTNIAVWNGDKFIFINYEFGRPYIEDVDYYGDVKLENIDGFIPIKEIVVEFSDIKKERNEQDYKNSARRLYLNLKNSDLKGEIWKDIPGYENKYYVSNYGRIKNNKKVMKQNFSRDYLVIGLTNDIRKTHRVHRLVMLTFSPVRKKNDEVNHKNGIKSDNRLENLEWVSHKDNSKKMFSSGNYIKKLNPEMVKEIKNLLKENKITQKEIAKRYNISNVSVSEINTGKKWIDVE